MSFKSNQQTDKSHLDLSCKYELYTLFNMEDDTAKAHDKKLYES